MAASDLLAGAVKSSEDSADMTSEPTQHDAADVVMIGFGAAGGCAVIEAYDAGEMCSVLQFVYQGGGNLAECSVFGRIAG